MNANLLPSKDAASYLHVTDGTLAVWRCKGRYKIPFVKVGRKVLYRVEDLDAFLASRTRTVA